METLSTTALWWAVIGSGVYHGLNPGMGWPLAVSAALMERRTAALPRSVIWLAVGHFLAMLAILLPFSVMIWLIELEREIRFVAGLLVIAAGVYLFFNRQHPRMLARIPPAKLGFWSFLSALAHGAGLMLLPVYLGLCGSGETTMGHGGMGTLMSGSVVTAVMVSIIHTGAMTFSGGAMAYAVYRWLGLTFISKSWFNLDAVWALSLILVGGVSLSV